MNIARRVRMLGLLLAALAVPACTTDADEAADADAAVDTADATTEAPPATPWEAARAAGIEFRGMGQEPGWTVEVDESVFIRYSGDYAETQIETGPPRKVTIGGAVTYHGDYEVNGEALELKVALREAPCQDSMSGESFTHEVTVTLGDGTEVRGCGRAP